MALLELNLEKPALVEERVTETGTSRSTGPSGSDDGGRSPGLLAVGVLAVVLVVALAVRRFRSSSDESTTETAADETSQLPLVGSSVARVAGLLGGVVGVVVFARRLRANA